MEGSTSPVSMGECLVSVGLGISGLSNGFCEFDFFMKLIQWGTREVKRLLRKRVFRI